MPIGDEKHTRNGLPSRSSSSPSTLEAAVEPRPSGNRLCFQASRLVRDPRIGLGPCCILQSPTSIRKSAVLLLLLHAMQHPTSAVRKGTSTLGLLESWHRPRVKKRPKSKDSVASCSPESMQPLPLLTVPLMTGPTPPPADCREHPSPNVLRLQPRPRPLRYTGLAEA
jgi:hypothetical protein